MIDKKRSAKKPNRLIAFDVEGVIIPKRRYLLFEARRRLGYWKTLKVMVIGFLYEVGALSLESALKRIFILFKGLTVEDLSQLYKQIPLIPGVEEFFKKLKEAGYRVALISSGLPAPFVKYLAARLNADYSFGLQLEVDNKRLTGKIGGDVIKPNGKALVLKEVLESEKLSPQDCVVVADDRNNLPMFPLCALRIGYNPDFLVSMKSDLVFRDALSEALPHLRGETWKVPRPGLSKSDFIRETIHISGALIPFVSIRLGRYLVSLLILLVILLYIVSEVARLEGTHAPLFSTVTRRAAIKPELYEFVTAPILFALGIMVSLIFFPVPVNYASVMILALGDGSATLLGKKFGRTVFPFNKAKRVEGSIFGFLFGFLGARLFIVSPVKALVGAAVGMLVESLPTPVSDNIAVPIISGLAMTAIP